jgi:hypothetical protein
MQRRLGRSAYLRIVNSIQDEIIRHLQVHIFENDRNPSDELFGSFRHSNWEMHVSG